PAGLCEGFYMSIAQADRGPAALVRPARGPTRRNVGIRGSYSQITITLQQGARCDLRSTSGVRECHRILGQTLMASKMRWSGISATYGPWGLPSTNSWVGQASSSDRIRRPAPRSARAYQDRGRWYPVVVTICPGATSQGISSEKGSRYLSIFRQTFVARKR